LILLLVLDRGPRFRRTVAAADVKKKGKSLSGPSRVRVGCTGRGLRPTLANSKENEWAGHSFGPKLIRKKSGL
jgi:hypothetical protein